MNIVGRESFLCKPSRRAGDLRRSRVYYRVRGDNGPDWDIPNNDISSVSHAVLERVFFVKDGRGGFERAPRPWEHESVLHDKNPKLSARLKIQERLSKFSSEMAKCAADHGVVSPCSETEFLDYYGGAKRKTYEHAVESFKTRSFEAKDGRVKVFTKDEYLKPGGCPRAIQPRSPRYNVKLGRYIKGIEHLIFEAIDDIFDGTKEHKTVAKGMNMIERGGEIKRMWDRYACPTAVGLDASRFDQHINELLLKFEHSIYKMWTELEGDDLPPLHQLLQAQLNNCGMYIGIDGVLKYKVNGCRMSGDMNTSLGNVIIMCSLMYSFFDTKKMLGKISLLNDGDDCVIIMERSDVKGFLDGLEDWFLEMGITMKVEGIFTSLEEIEFCQSRPVFNEDFGYVLIPRPQKRLYSDLISTKNLRSKKVYRKQVGAIAGCGMALSSGTPIFQNFYSWLGRGACPWIPEQGDYYYKYRQELVDRMMYRYRKPSMRERVSFYFAFDITPSEQLVLEKYYDALPDPGYSEPVFDPRRALDLHQCLAEPEQKSKREV
ncbi:hypothetical protein 2 [Beihai tombus-like virus 3]|uniref:hypothetical protein 2 n=1 Tax=Beihai tombus-like virus 3 TaxID=1922724 RepID=UPI00090C02CC|nr:hypothetical protein 2 [Beihai tombus-like virus 3]APG76188.1 hypothetical protein 2 [Beihai tombus-like virus 3]